MRNATHSSFGHKRWVALGAALAMVLGAGTVAVVGAAGSGTASAFVPITPCRLLDTRPAPNSVGPRATPIGAGESLTVQVTGSHGDCTIPVSATAIVLNTTSVGATAAGFVTLFPADESLPNVSNLNTTPGQSPTPNLVTVTLSATGAVKVFNAFGTVNIIGDIAGYYEPTAGGPAGPAGPQGPAGAFVDGEACVASGVPGTVINGWDHLRNQTVKCFGNVVTTFAGTGTAGFADGTGHAAQFAFPAGVAVDVAGNVYVAGFSSHRIRMVSPAGAVTTLAGSTAGFADGTGAAARFNSPTGIAVDVAGNVYVADQGNDRIRKVSPAGVVTTLAGSASGFADGAGAAAQFAFPAGVAVDVAGNVYVGDQGNDRIRKVSPAGVVTTLAGSASGFADGTGAAARFSNPRGVAVDAAGNVYVADRGNDRIRKVSPAGVVTTLAGSASGFADGTGAAAQFNFPSGVAVDVAGNVYVADSFNDRIRKVSPAGVVTTLAGSSAGFADGTGAAAQFDAPFGVAVDATGMLIVADQRNHRIRLIN